MVLRTIEGPADPLITTESISTRLNQMPLIGVAVENVEASANCATRSPTARFFHFKFVIFSNWSLTLRMAVMSQESIATRSWQSDWSVATM